MGSVPERIFLSNGILLFFKVTFMMEMGDGVMIPNPNPNPNPNLYDGDGRRCDDSSNA